MTLKDKLVVITGASKGLGREIAILSADEGARLALLARSEKELKELSSLLKNKGCDCKYFVCDVADEKQVFSTFDNIRKDFGEIDILVNNAGIWFEGKLEEHTPQKIKELFGTVTLGTIFCSLAVLPQLKKQKRGQILNIISVAGIETPGENGPFSPYTAAKYAITGFTKSLEEELKGTGIKILGFYPGGMNTEMFRLAGFNYSDNESWMMDKKDVAEIVIFILKRPGNIVMDHVVVRKLQ